MSKNGRHAWHMPSEQIIRHLKGLNNTYDTGPEPTRAFSGVCNRPLSTPSKQLTIVEQIEAKLAECIKAEEGAALIITDAAQLLHTGSTLGSISPEEKQNILISARGITKDIAITQPHLANLITENFLLPLTSDEQPLLIHQATTAADLQSRPSPGPGN